MKISSYRDLEVWKKSIELSKAIYKITKTFPEDEKYGLTNQLRRCSVSIPSNIAEGSSRRTTGDFIRFVNIASGSVAELETQLILSKEFGYLKEGEFDLLFKDSNIISKMLYGLYDSLANK